MTAFRALVRAECEMLVECEMGEGTTLRQAAAAIRGGHYEPESQWDELKGFRVSKVRRVDDEEQDG